MPNWCDNELYIYGKIDKINEVLEAIKGKPYNDDPEHESPLDFNKIIPYPEKYEAMDKASREFQGLWQDRPKDGYNSGGYEWCIANWGTKWNACDVELTIKKRSAVITFNTAWSPPIPIVKALMARFTSVDFKLKYYEAGAGFCGEYGANGDYYNNGYRGHRGG